MPNSTPMRFQGIPARRAVSTAPAIWRSLRARARVARRLERVADTYESKYGAHFAAPNGTWSGLGDASCRAEALVYRVAPMTGFGFGKGKPFSQTRWRFS
jgi:hypothetical protein